MSLSLSSLASWSPILAWRCSRSSRHRIEFRGSGAERVSQHREVRLLEAAEDAEAAASEVTSIPTRLAGTRMSDSWKERWHELHTEVAWISKTWQIAIFNVLELMLKRSKYSLQPYWKFHGIPTCIFGDKNLSNNLPLSTEDREDRVYTRTDCTRR